MTKQPHHAHRHTHALIWKQKEKNTHPHTRTKTQNPHASKLTGRQAGKPIEQIHILNYNKNKRLKKNNQDERTRI